MNKGKMFKKRRKNAGIKREEILEEKLETENKRKEWGEKEENVKKKPLKTRRKKKSQ